MDAIYTVQLYSPAGVLVADLPQWQTLSLARSVNNPGTMTIALPFSWRLWDACPYNAIFEVWRRGETGARRVMDAVWFVRARQWDVGSDGSKTMTFTCCDQLEILQHAIVYAQSGSSGSVFTGAAETLIKSVVGTHLLTRMGLTQITLEPDAGRGQADLAIDCSMQNVLSVCQLVAQASTAYDPVNAYVAFDLQPQGPLAYIFRVFLGTRGANRSAGQAMALLVSPEGGQFTTGTYKEDFTAAASAFITAGSAASGTQIYVEADNANLGAAGPFARRELYASGQATDNGATLETIAARAMRAGRPPVQFSGTLVPAPGFEYGTHWDFGDELSVSFDGHALPVPARLETLQISLSQAQGETFTATCKSELI